MSGRPYVLRGHLGGSFDVVLAILAWMLVVPLCACSEEGLEGRVVGITDGDTVTVLVERQQIKIRLAEIDAPERGQPWGKRSKEALSALIFGANPGCVSRATSDNG